MADGGSFLDGVHGVVRGWKRAERRVGRLQLRLALSIFHPSALGRVWPFLRHVWAWGHDDQRASWVCHFSICWAVTTVAAWFDVSELAASGAMAAIYVFREIGDMWFHRRKAQDVDRLDADTDWQGRKKAGVTPLYDGFADGLLPVANFLARLRLP